MTTLVDAAIVVDKASHVTEEITRVTIGFCTNMWLDGYAVLFRRQFSSLLEITCSQIFASATAADPSLSEFAASLVTRGSSACVPAMRVLATSAEFSDPAAWELISGQSSSGPSTFSQNAQRYVEVRTRTRPRF